MSRWERFVHGRLGLAVGIAGALAVPLVGIFMLRFLLGGVPVEAPAPGPAATVAAPAATAEVQMPTQAPQLPTVLPETTPTPVPTPTASPTPTSTPVPVAVVNATAGLNVREEPTTQSRVLRILPYETEVRLTGRERTSEGLLWVEIEEEGWVQARYLDR